ncbi:hypothetical protein Tco_0576060 [Tanacetum coccineum]
MSSEAIVRNIFPAGKVIIIVSPGRLSLVPTGRILSPGSKDLSRVGSNKWYQSEATIPQQQRNIQPQIITTISNNNTKFPYLKKDEYEVWAMKMEYWITNNDMNIWKVIQNGNSLKRTGRDHDRRVIILPPTTADEHIAVQRESKARTTLLQSIPDDHVADFHYMDDARDIWNAVKARFGRNAESKKMGKSMLKQEFLEFIISEAEGLHKGYDRMQKILTLPSSWSQVALTLKTKGGLELLSFDDLYYKLKTLESIPDDHVADFHYMDNARDIWNAVKARFGGNAESKKMRKPMLKQKFVEFRISEAEGLHKGYDRIQKILSQLNQLKAKPEDEDINLKFLRTLPSSWSQVALTLKTKGGLELLSFDDLYYKFVGS